MKKNTNYEMCKACGGHCCKQVGCGYMPDDFKSMKFDKIKTIISRGNISISGEPLIIPSIIPVWSYVLFLRARNVNAPIVDLIVSNGPCKLLTENGCSLNEEDRPSLGLALKPTNIGGPCNMQEDIKPSLAWLKYNKVLTELVYYYEKKDVLTIIKEQIRSAYNKALKKQKSNILLTDADEYALDRYDLYTNYPYMEIEQVKHLELFKDIIN